MYLNKNFIYLFFWRTHNYPFGIRFALENWSNYFPRMLKSDFMNTKMVEIYPKYLKIQALKFQALKY